jgi:hypothetical protein
MGDFERGTSALGKRRMFNLSKRNSEPFHVAGTSAKEISRVAVTEPMVVVGRAALAGG